MIQYSLGDALWLAEPSAPSSPPLHERSCLRGALLVVSLSRFATRLTDARRD